MLQQVLVNGIILGLQYALLGVAFWILYRTSGFLDFGFGSAFVLGPYGVVLMSSQASGMIIVGSCVGVLIALGFGYGCHAVLYSQLRRRRGVDLGGLLASMGVFIVVENALVLAFGAKNRPLQTWSVQEGLHVVGARLSELQLWKTGGEVLLLLIIVAFINRTRLGRVAQAISSDADLAAAYGLPVAVARREIAALAYGVAAYAGILAAIETNAYPAMGFTALLSGVVTGILGGQLGVRGIIGSGLLVGLSTEIGALVVGSGWQDGILFCVLVAAMLLRGPRLAT